MQPNMPATQHMPVPARPVPAMHKPVVASKQPLGKQSKIAVGVAIVVAILVVVMVVIVIVTSQKSSAPSGPPAPPGPSGSNRYACVNNSCQVQTNGPYSDLTSCNNACNTYGCKAGTCQPNQGTQSLSDCQVSCVKHYKCVNNACQYSDDPTDPTNSQTCCDEPGLTFACQKLPDNTYGCVDTQKPTGQSQDTCKTLCGAPSKFCTTSYARPKSSNSTNMPWSQAGFMSLDGVDCPTFENALTSGLLHGMPYFPFCDTTVQAASDDKVSQRYCNSNQFFMSQVAPADSTTLPAKTSIYVAPYGQVLDNLDPPNASTSKPSKPNFVSASCQTKPGPNQVCVDAFVFDQNPATGSPASAKRLVDSQGNFLYKLAVYHGGIVGAPVTNLPCMADYYKVVADFVKARQIDIVFTSLQAPIVVGNNLQFLYNLTPDFLVENFYTKLDQNTQVGVLAYINPKDSSWDFQQHADPGLYDQVCKANQISEQYAGSCYKNAWSASLFGGNEASLDPKLPTGACTTPGYTSPAASCPVNSTDYQAPCPNVASQLAAYVKYINTTIANYKSANPAYAGPTDVAYLAYDKEDQGQDTLAYCHIRATLDDANVKLSNVKVGSAGGLSMVDQPGYTNDFVMPEIYWYANILSPCRGSNAQIGKIANLDNPKTYFGYPQVCTTGNLYRKVGDMNLSGASFFDALMDAGTKLEASNPAMFQNNMATMVKNLHNNPSGVWPMMSCENLSAGKDGQAGQAVPSCLALKANSNVVSEPDMCGTFDGISTWTWDQVIQFFNRLYQTAFPKGTSVVPTFGLYELQFIPPGWLDSSSSNKAMQFDASLMPNCVGSGGGGGGGKSDGCNPANPTGMHCTASDLSVCDAYLKATPGCANFYSECHIDDKTTPYCQFHVNSTNQSNQHNQNQPNQNQTKQTKQTKLHNRPAPALPAVTQPTKRVRQQF